MKNKRSWSWLLGSLLGLFVFFGCPEETQASIAAAPPHVTLENIFNTPTISGKTNAASYTQDGIVTVTPLKAAQVGAIWSTDENRLDFKKDFYLSAYVNLGDEAFASGDGMVFVIQAVDSRQGPTWFTHQGSGLGALGQESISTTATEYSTLGIRSSVGIEFDLYGNLAKDDGFFDAQTVTDYRKQHIAYVWPGSLIGYQDVDLGNWLIHNYRRYVQHFALNTDFNASVGSTPFLANGRWTKLEVKWSVEDQLLQYRVDIGDTNWVTIDSGNLGNIVLNTDFNPEQLAYWGFTGATGPSFKANQQVVFESVPGLVEATTAIESYRGSESIPAQGFVETGETVTVISRGEYLGGKQGWKNVTTTLTLPAGTRYVENSATLLNEAGEKTALAGVVYDESQRTVTFPAVSLDLAQADYRPSIEVEILPEATGTLDYVATFNGSNLMQTTETYRQKVAAVSEAKVTVNQQADSHLFDNESSLQNFDGIWADIHAPAETKAKYRTFLNAELLAEIALTGTNCTGKWQQTVDMTDKDYGEYTFTIQLLDFSGKIIDEKTVPFYYQNRPEIQVLNPADLTGETGTIFQIPYQWQDLDSESVTLYSRFNDEEPQILANQLENLNPGTLHEGLLELDTATAKVGENTWQLYAVDSEGNQSSILNQKIQLEGTLHYRDIPGNYQMPEKVFVNQNQVYLPMDGEKVTAEDARGTNQKWQVRLSLLTEFSCGDHQLKNILYYEKNATGEKIPVTQTESLLVEAVSSAGDVIPVLGDDESSGLYLKIPANAYVGSYQATLKWTLQDAV